MTDQTTDHQTNGGERQKESAEELRVKAEHRQALARIESEDRRMMADMYRNLPIPLRVMFDPMLNERVKMAAEMMSRAEGFTPRHLLGKLEACFVVVTKALTWRLDPQAVAASTYQTPDGKVGYEGRLIQAIIEGSGKLSRPIGQGEYYGDWSKVEGRFRIVKKQSQSGKDYAAPEPLWEYFGPDEEGLGVRYEVWLNGQHRPLKFEFKLRSAYPRNATTWPTRPQQQLHYAAMRALGNVVCPSLIMGVPFPDDLTEPEREMRNITPEAPPPVDLDQEGISGQGPMSASEEAAQGRTSGPELQQGDGATADGKPSWTVDGKTYLQAGRVQSVLIGKVEGVRNLDGLEPYDIGEMADLISTLPAANRQAVEHAVEHQRSVLDADRGERASSDDDGGDHSMAELDKHETEEFRRSGERPQQGRLIQD